jgi:hypothetical protein
MKRGGFISRRSKLSPISKRRAPQLRQYAKQRKRFLAEHPICQVWCAHNGWTQTPEGSYSGHGKLASDKYLVEIGAQRAVDVHHKRGRIGLMLIAEEHWMAVSRKAHDWIHANPKEARARGWLE